MKDFSFGLETDDEEIGIVGKILYDAPSDYIKANEVICILLHKKGTVDRDKEESDSNRIENAEDDEVEDDEVSDNDNRNKN